MQNDVNMLIRQLAVICQYKAHERGVPRTNPRDILHTTFKTSARGQPNVYEVLDRTPPISGSFALRLPLIGGCQIKAGIHWMGFTSSARGHDDKLRVRDLIWKANRPLGRSKSLGPH